MSFSVNDHSIDKRSIWSFDQWSFWHELNIELAEMIILLIKDENDDQALHLKQGSAWLKTINKRKWLLVDLTQPMLIARDQED